MRAEKDAGAGAASCRERELGWDLEQELSAHERRSKANLQAVQDLWNQLRVRSGWRQVSSKRQREGSLS